MSLRPVSRLIKSKPTLEGAGVHLRRAFGFGHTTETDPFLLLDDFRNERPEDYLAGFPWHPHRGIETITYVLAGEVEHSARVPLPRRERVRVRANRIHRDEWAATLSHVKQRLSELKFNDGTVVDLGQPAARQGAPLLSPGPRHPMAVCRHCGQPHPNFIGRRTPEAPLLSI